MSLAPVILFVYNRPDHTRRTLESLRKNELAVDSELYIFADGAKANASAETKELITKTRKLLAEKKWCGQVHIRERESNRGLAASVLDGVGEVIGKYGRVIVLEDDMVTAPGFLKFMNAALGKYEAEPDVACISGYVYPLKRKMQSAFFVKGADCWGWATWEKRWNEFRSNSEGLREKIMEKDLLSQFTFNGSYPYMEMLMDQEEGRNQSWAILWYAWALVNGKLCLYPPASLVHNTGNDGSGTHAVMAIDKFNVELGDEEQAGFPPAVAENQEGRKAFELFFTSMTSSPGIYDRMMTRLKRIFSK